MKRRPLAEWRAIRALVEGAKPTIELVAQATRRSPRLLALEAEREGWRLDRLPEEDLAEKVRAISGLLLEGSSCSGAGRWRTASRSTRARSTACCRS